MMGDRDINDVHRAEGLDAARALHDSAKPFGGDSTKARKPNGAGHGASRRALRWPWKFHGDVDDQPLKEWLLADALATVCACGPSG
jgi:hypothetical protein